MFDRIKEAAAGRWAEILPAVTPLSPEVLTKRAEDHPCPVCGGRSTIWPAEDAQQTGRIACRNCTKDGNPTGDGITTVAVFAGCEQGVAARMVAEYLGLSVSQAVGAKPPERDIVAEVARDKRMPLEAFKQFGATAEKRGRERSPVARVPAYDESGEPHSYYDFAPGHKGWFARGKGMSGMFLPGRKPTEGETWYVVEGCKDAAALVGLGFNAAGMPTSCLAAKYAELFRGCHVVLVPDLDTAGQLGAQKSGGNLTGIAESVRVARLPGEVVEKGGDDVRDVLRREGGEALVRSAIAAAEPWTPRPGEHDPSDGRPEVMVTLAYGWVADQVVEHLGQLGWETPWIPARKRERLKLYQRGGVLVQVVAEDEPTELPGGITMPAGQARIRPLPPGQLPLRIADACQLIVEKETSEGVERVAVPPQRWLVDGVASMGEYGAAVRRLEGITLAPTLRPDGSILQRPGYDTKTRLLYQPAERFPPVPDQPTQRDAERAAAELLDVVADFPFESEGDRSAWLSMVLTMIGRPAIAGCCPLFAGTATTRGSGKSLLADAASLIAYGRPAARKPYAQDDDEMRKAITATAMEALPAVLLDNVDRTLGGASLDAALTALTWSDRVLGSSRTTGELPMRTIWAATGNNLRFGSDLARRVLPIRLAPVVERPEDRDDFKQPDLLGWVRENRPRLAVAALTILRAYCVAGRPEQPGGRWGSFEAWSALVRGAIVWVGLADPLATREAAQDDDTSAAVVAGLVGGLLEVDEHGDGMTVKEIVDALNDPGNASRFPALREAVAEVATHRGIIDQRRLGYALRRYRGRVVGGWRITHTPGRGRVHKWLAERAVGGGDGGDGGDGFPHLYAGGRCVTHANTHATHTYANGDGLEVSPPSPPSPPKTPPTGDAGRGVDDDPGVTI